MTRIALYTDYSYSRDGDQIYAERAFALFVFALAAAAERLTLLGKIAPQPGTSHYPVPDQIDFRELPFFADATDLRRGGRAMVGSLQTFWRALDDVDVVWLLGPHPLAVAYALVARIRRRPVVLGVRQDFRRYVRARHPARRWVHAAGDALEWVWGRLARSSGVIAVGDELAALYPRSRRLTMAVSLVPRSALRAPDAPAADFSAVNLGVLSVGRLEAEKNPLLLADVMRRLLDAGDERWHLTVCGEGPLKGALEQRAAELGVSDRITFAGYVPFGDGLEDLYASSHALLHVSRTEGVPQILYEAFAARLPIVATAVGGVTAAAGPAAILVAPDDPGAAADALRRVADEPDLRRVLLDAGTERVAEHTLELEVERVLAFLSAEART